MLTKMKSASGCPDKETHIELHFKDGIPVKVINTDNKESYTDPLELFVYLNKIGGENGVGLLDMVENRFVGMKSRGVYETPAGTIILRAHMDMKELPWTGKL
jgi:argininosuccinate synthase